MVKHSTLTGAALHEPKGVATATSGQVYVADGAGSGTWTTFDGASVDITDAGGYFTGTEVETALQEIGVATPISANANEVFVSDGAAGGSFIIPNPMGGWRYSNIGVGTTFTAPTTDTLMNVAGAATAAVEFSTNNLGRLTYTGTPDRHVHLVCDMSFKHSTGAGQDCYFTFYKNGLTTSDINVQTADSGNFQQIACHWDGMLSTNDYIEVYLRTASGNIIVHAAYMFMVGMPV